MHAFSQLFKQPNVKHFQVSSSSPIWFTIFISGAVSGLMGYWGSVARSLSPVLPTLVLILIWFDNNDNHCIIPFDQIQNFKQFNDSLFLDTGSALGRETTANIELIDSPEFFSSINKKVFISSCQIFSHNLNLIFFSPALCFYRECQPATERSDGRGKQRRREGEGDRGGQSWDCGKQA